MRPLQKVNSQGIDFPKHHPTPGTVLDAFLAIPRRFRLCILPNIPSTSYLADFLDYSLIGNLTPLDVEYGPESRGRVSLDQYCHQQCQDVH